MGEAEKICNAIIGAMPNHIDAINLIGIIAQRSNRHDIAVEKFHTALQFNSSRSMLHYNLGISLHKLKRHDEAVAALTAAYEKDPDDENIINFLNSITGGGPIRPKGTASTAEAEEAEPKNAAVHKPAKASRSEPEKAYYKTDQHGTIKLNKPIWLILLFSMRYLLILFLGKVGKLPELVDFIKLQPILLVGSLPPLLIMATDFNRVPNVRFAHIWRTIWKSGRWLLILGLVVDLTLTIMFQQDDIKRLQVLPLMSVVMDPLFIIYLLTSKFAKELFADFPESTDENAQG